MRDLHLPAYNRPLITFSYSIACYSASAQQSNRVRVGYPSNRVNPSWRSKDSPGLQEKSHR